jgi:LPXTG-site transpeptidase (sortase) family protein
MIFFVVAVLVLGMILQAYQTINPTRAKAPEQSMPMVQVVNDTPTPTSTATSTATPTLVPVELSFQYGVQPSSSYSGMVDTFISQADSFGNYGQTPQLQVNGQSSPAATDANYVLLKWDISQIPTGSEVLAATLVFNILTPTVDTYPIYQVLKPWVFNQANWINYAGGSAWEAPGAVGATDRGTQVLGSFAPMQTGTYTINLNRATVQSWVNNPIMNNGIIIADSSGSAPVIFDSAESTTPANRPILRITFNYPPGTTPTATLTQTPTATSTSTATAQPTPAAPTNLSAVAASTTQINLTWVDNSNDEDGFQIERSLDNSTWSLIATTAANITSFSNSGLTINTLYYYRVRAFNAGGNSGFSNVASASTAATLTPTPTVSGTPATPTATGTIFPSMITVKSVSPSQASVGQLFNFTIRVTNDGLATALSATLTDTFPSVVTITGASTTQGTYTINTSTNTIVFSIGNISPGQTVQTGILAQVNSTATANTNYTNSATLSYRIETINQTATSNSIAYRVLGSGTLPPTGLAEINQDGSTSVIFVTALIFAFLLAILGIGAIIVSRLENIKQSPWAGWLNKTGIILLISSLVFGLVTYGLRLPTQNTTQNAALVDTNTPVLVEHNPNSDIAYQMKLPTPTPEVLPDFPVPEPTLGPEHDDTTDKSSIQQIRIPALGLDTVVKYVPFDGFTWQIAGLKQEVAWMGDTSWPGLGKNTGLAGHVTLVDGSNGPFRYLADLRPGDSVVVSTEENIYTYTVREQVVVADDDFTVLEATNKPQLTLITCTNWNSEMRIYMNRLVVYADLQEVEPKNQVNIGN